MGFSFVVLIPAVLCTMGCLSQVVMILIAKGLQGDFSAKTFLQVLSVAQVAQQLYIMYLSICGTLGYCFLMESDMQCKFQYHMSVWIFLTPDWLAVPVSVDRLNAIQFPVWYKQNCTTKTAWYLLAPLVAMVGLILVPISAFIVRIDDGINVYCSNKNGIVENMVGVVGIPPILAVSVATLALLYIIHGRNKKSNNATDDKELIIFKVGS
ncbi:uncharacterized protein LOC134856294 [Symsagittifera roscoffensis]|uniref:uncharacterized protein LOC134856294 n=1 Tax=Symsagittifera roscoffensis TaxID=84072 RepID=UPI00307B5EE7